MYKKLFISLGILVALVFSASVCFAADNNIMQDAATGVKDAVNNVSNGVKDTMSNAGNAIEGATKNVTGTSRNVTANMENTASNMTTGNNNDTNYNATRTATETTGTTFMGMNATAWTWLIMGIAAIAIIALVWYYSAQLRSSDYDDRD